MNNLLRQHPEADVRVFVVWEPILPSDWGAPGTLVLRRLSDRRVEQFWDKDNVIAAQLARDARPPQPKQECCVHDEILWDLVAVYPPGSAWTTTAPVARVFNGPVVNVTSEVEAAISALK